MTLRPALHSGCWYRRWREVVSTFVRKTYFIFIHDTELNRPLLWFTSLKLFHFLKQLYSSECTHNLDEVKYFEFFKRLYMCLGNEIWNKTKIVYLAMPASMSHCFVILFYTQTSFNRGFLYRKTCKCIKKKTVPYLWWKSCRSKNTYQRRQSLEK